MRRRMYMVALALVATLVLAPGAMALQMNGEHMMPNGQMMDGDMMASPSHRLVPPLLLRLRLLPRLRLPRWFRTSESSSWRRW